MIRARAAVAGKRQEAGAGSIPAEVRIMEYE